MSVDTLLIYVINIGTLSLFVYLFLQALFSPRRPVARTGSNTAPTKTGYRRSTYTDHDEGVSGLHQDVNPSTGLPLTGGPGSPDIGGHSYGSFD